MLTLAFTNGMTWLSYFSSLKLNFIWLFLSLTKLIQVNLLVHGLHLLIIQQIFAIIITGDHGRLEVPSFLQN